MTPRKIKTREEEKTAAKDYIRKAGDNCKAMFSAQKEGNFNAVGTLALQCAISSADAICVFEKGIRSISQNHLDVCDILKSITLPDAEGKANLFRRIISKKNLVQYEGRNMYQGEADEIAKAASRFYEWVYSNIK